MFHLREDAMQSTFRSRSALLATLLAFVLAAVTPTIASAVPKPGASAQRGFRLFARSLGAMTINRVLCGLSSDGQICVDSTNSSTVGGGFWPKGTADQYVFNTGLQLAGIIGTDGGPWAGDTTGAFFFDPKGTTQHGLEVQPIYNFNNPADLAEVAADPNHPARVPTVPDPQADVFETLLQGRPSASQGDIWFMSWDGDPSFGAGRPHPLGVVVETRGLGWNFPSGNEDLLYFVYTFYNVTSLNRGDYEAEGIRSSVVDILTQQAQEFHSRNNAASAVTLPPGGYTVDPLFAAFGTDMDVASAGTNWAGVILPFALGTTFDGAFDRFEGWTFDPAIFSAPFFAGSGFVGVKYLKSPTGAGAIQLYSNTINGGEFDDPQNTTQLFRYLSGEISVLAGDAPCNSGDPKLSRICFLNNNTHDDMRFFQSSTPLALGPGQLGTIVVSYIFAAPVSVGGCPAAPCADIPPGLQVVGNQAVHGNAGLMVSPGVALADSVAGYLGFNDANTDGIVTQDEYIVVPGSLLGKSLTAQAIFNSKFLLPFAPESPEFYLVPSDNRVTVLWRPTVSETTPDPFFTVAKDPLTGTAVNALYDPNYREFDVEGYRVYRGRVDASNELTLLAQFDKGGTFIRDFAGQVNPVDLCAPEILITADCAVTYGPVDPVNGGFIPGQARTGFVDVPLVGEIVQVKIGAVQERAALADGSAIVLVADTAVTGNASGNTELRDSGIPFVFVDNAVRNNFRYFYSVTAFDVNSWQSGPTSLESPRNTIATVPVASASNYVSSGGITSIEILGRTQVLDASAPLPTLDPVNGTFSGPMPPADAASVGFLGDIVSQVIAEPGTLEATLDSITLGDAWSNPGGTPVIYHWTAVGAAGSSQVDIVLEQDWSITEVGTGPGDGTFPAIFPDQTLAARYGGDATFTLGAKLNQRLAAAYLTNGTGRGSAGFGNSATDDDLDFNDHYYDGSRWFSGDNETKAHPTEGNCIPNCSMTNFNNAGALDNVTTVYQPLSYTTMNLSWREAQGVMSGAARAADMKVYWAGGGAVDSVIDVTHDLEIPFSTEIGASWGFLNTSAATGAGSHDGQPTRLTVVDFMCVEPYLTLAATRQDCSAATPYLLSNTAELGEIGFFTTNVDASQTAPAAAEPGFGIYMPGHLYLMEMSELPQAGDVWTLRTYIGAVKGGVGDGGVAGENADEASYSFVSGPRTPPPGLRYRVSYDVTNTLSPATGNDLSRVHTVPDPYYVTNEFETTTLFKVLKFVNLPTKCIIRIYSSSGVLVALLEHNSDRALAENNSTTLGGSEDWNVRNRNNQVVASGVYFYHIEAGDARHVGRFTVVNFAQ
jgi:hypothetical protein